MFHRGLVFAFLLPTLAGRSAAQARDTVPVLNVLQDISQYVGTYPCRNGLLRAPLLMKSLREVLDGQYTAYGDHMSASGCGAIERQGDYILMDVSQLHGGGYSSIILIRKGDGALFLFWMNGTVSDRRARVYGPHPVPAAVLATIAHHMNVVWGHVACFHPTRDSIAIDLTRRANQDTGRCLGA